MRRDGRTLLYRRELGEERLLTTLLEEHRGNGFGIELVSTGGTGHFYTSSKNPKKTTEKLQIVKYDPVLRKRVPYKEAKI